MNAHKKQTIQKLIMDQSGSQTLDLNDIVLGYEGARIVGALLPQYHKNIRHLRINGNNIDGEGFQFVFTGLMHCPYLKSVEAEWNSIGSSDVGLAALSALVNQLQYLEFIDLKNNRISHHLAHFIADIIEMNKKCLKVIDLRWNQLGQLGAKQIYAALSMNKNIKFIGLQDNRISMATLMEIQNLLKGKQEQPRQLKHSHSLPNPQYFPISADQYPSMDVQLKTGELRKKIQNQQKQATRYTQKIEIEIQKILQKIKLKGTQTAQMQLRHDALMSQNLKVTSQLRQAERMLALQKERNLGNQTRYSDEKSKMRNQKYQMNSSIQNVMEKFTQRNQRELDQIQLVMGQKLDRLNAFLKQRLFQKRGNRQKLLQLKQDILKLKALKQQVSTKQINSPNVYNIKKTWQQQFFSINEEIALAQSTINNEVKKGEYMSKQLNNQILKSLTREQNLQKQIFAVQNKIKNIHHQMAIKNLQLQKNLAMLRLKQSEIFDKESTIEMENNYLKYMHSEGNVKFQVQSMVEEELNIGAQKSDENIQARIVEVERALRAQQAQNRMIKNQYEKLMSQLETITKKNIQLVLFE